MGNVEDSFGYVQIITASDAASLDDAVNGAIADRRCNIVGYAVGPASTYSCMVYFYGEKPSDDDLGQNPSEQDQWAIERRTVLELVKQYGADKAADEFGFSSAKDLKKHYNLE